MEATERKIIEQLLETIKEKDATIKELKAELKRLDGSLYLNLNNWQTGFSGIGCVATNPEGKIEAK